MDSATLDSHADFWGLEPSPLRMDLPRLTPQEQGVYDTLRDNRIRAGLRLEQETMGFAWVEKYLQALLQDQDGAARPDL